MGVSLHTNVPLKGTHGAVPVSLDIWPWHSADCPAMLCSCGVSAFSYVAPLRQCQARQAAFDAIHRQGWVSKVVHMAKRFDAAL